MISSFSFDGLSTEKEKQQILTFVKLEMFIINAFYYTMFH